VALYILTCLDIENGLDLRMSVRPDHLAYLADLKDCVKLAGPLLDEITSTPIGSHLIIVVEGLAQAEAFAANDPYAKAGLFKSVTINQFRATIGSFGT
jgi:uncharacterized protein